MHGVVNVLNTGVRSYYATDVGIDGTTVSRDNSASLKAICSIGSCSDAEDLGWTVVGTYANKTKTKRNNKI